eukprot:6491645-Heterocapsa_arctica.AAC.1
MGPKAHPMQSRCIIRRVSKLALGTSADTQTLCVAAHAQCMCPATMNSFAAVLCTKTQKLEARTKTSASAFTMCALA